VYVLDCSRCVCWIVAGVCVELLQSYVLDCSRCMCWIVEGVCVGL